MSVGAGLDQFIQDLQKILRATWGEKWGELIEGLPIRDNTTDLPMPMIVAHLVSRRPSEHLKNIKPMVVGTIVDPDRLGLIDEYAMWYDVDLEFQVYHNTHSSAKEMAEGLEEVLLSFSGYFKERGIHEILFREELEPNIEKSTRLLLPCRHLRYYLRLEKQFLIHRDVVAEIQAIVNVRDNPA